MSSIKIILIVIGFITFFTYGTLANVFFHPMKKEDLIRPVADVLYRMKHCEIAWINTAALRRDFPFLKGSKSEVIKKWVIENFCYMSSEQARLEGFRCEGINEYCSRDETKIAYRQPIWGRAATVPVTDLAGQYPPQGGMVDVKGIGHASSNVELHKNDATPIEKQIALFQNANAMPDGPEKEEALAKVKDMGHSNGMLQLQSGLVEVVRTAVLQQYFAEVNIKENRPPQEKLQAVEMYFLMMHPIQSKRYPNAPQALLGRQAHVGRSFSLGGTIGIYEDEFGRRQADAFSAAVDMESIDFSKTNCEHVNGDFYETLAETVNDYTNGNKNAIIERFMQDTQHVRTASLPCPKDDYGLCLDVTPPFTLKYALETVFGRGKYKDPVESTRVRYNHREFPEETYHQVTNDLFRKDVIQMYMNQFPKARKPKIYNGGKNWHSRLKLWWKRQWKKIRELMNLNRKRQLQ